MFGNLCVTGHDFFTGASWCFKSPTPRLLFLYVIQANNRENIRALVDSPHKEPAMRKVFYVIVSSWSNGTPKKIKRSREKVIDAARFCNIIIIIIVHKHDAKTTVGVENNLLDGIMQNRQSHTSLYHCSFCSGTELLFSYLPSSNGMTRLYSIHNRFQCRSEIWGNIYMCIYARILFVLLTK